MKNNFNYSIEVSKETIEKLRTNKIAVDKAKAIAYNVSNVIKAGIAKAKFSK